MIKFKIVGIERKRSGVKVQVWKEQVQVFKFRYQIKRIKCKIVAIERKF